MKKYLVLLLCSGALLTASLQHVAHAQETAKAAPTASPTAPASKPLSSASELEYLRAYSTFAVAETQAYSAQSEATAAQARFAEAKRKYDAQQASFGSVIKGINDRDGCTEIQPNDGHPLCVLKPAKK